MLSAPDHIVLALNILVMRFRDWCCRASLYLVTLRKSNASHKLDTLIPKWFAVRTCPYCPRFHHDSNTRFNPKRSFEIPKASDNSPAPTLSPTLPHSIFPDPHEDFFRYTTGRWLWNEEEQLRKRYRRFNVEELQNAAARALGGTSRCIQ
ncbi:hypothetical protein CISG_04325 [Coccidioides immitis RMSCC 3703]|uniref:Uncharacterized protein n=1 Tax=Coccidioides immitis RMSCC 3703 TaxID=454286 RepID=A0A0J8QUT5_COCIT|nr:hypothetical protein CISG_04325 [Coccidioides immitis RMSCC 3703]